MPVVQQKRTERRRAIALPRPHDFALQIEEVGPLGIQRGHQIIALESAWVVGDETKLDLGGFLAFVFFGWLRRAFVRTVFAFGRFVAILWRALRGRGTEYRERQDQRS